MSALRTDLEALAAELHTQGWSQGPRYAAKIRALIAEPDELQMALGMHAVQHNRANYLEADRDAIAAKASDRLARVLAIHKPIVVTTVQGPKNTTCEKCNDEESWPCTTARAALAEGPDA